MRPLDDQLPTDDQLRKALHDMIDVVEPTQLHAIYLICAKLYLKWNEKTGICRMSTSENYE